MKVITIGLRRSGTTIFWRLLGQNKRLLSLNEPFHPNLKSLVDSNIEWFRDYSNINRQELFDRYRPILPKEELVPRLTYDQSDYLRYIMAIEPHMNIDIVRGVFKIRELADIVPDGLFIYLYRDVRAFVTSHLVPSHERYTIRTRLGSAYNKWTFWSRRNRYNFYFYEEIIEKYGKDYFGQIFSDRSLKSIRAVEKLSALWMYAYETAVLAKRELGDRLVMLPFERMVENPAETVKHIYHYFGEKFYEGDSSILKNAKQGYQAESSKWAEVFLKIGRYE